MGVALGLGCRNSNVKGGVTYGMCPAEHLGGLGQ